MYGNRPCVAQSQTKSRTDHGWNRRLLPTSVGEIVPFLWLILVRPSVKGGAERPISAAECEIKKSIKQKKPPKYAKILLKRHCFVHS